MSTVTSPSTDVPPNVARAIEWEKLARQREAEHAKHKEELEKAKWARTGAKRFQLIQDILRARISAEAEHGLFDSFKLRVDYYPTPEALGNPNLNAVTVSLIAPGLARITSNFEVRDLFVGQMNETWKVRALRWGKQGPEEYSAAFDCREFGTALLRAREQYEAATATVEVEDLADLHDEPAEA